MPGLQPWKGRSRCRDRSHSDNYNNGGKSQQSGSHQVTVQIGHKAEQRDSWLGVSKRQQRKTSPNQLWDIEVLEEEEYRVKIHYTGYSAKHGRWIRKSEIKYKPVASSIPDEQLSLLKLMCLLAQ